LTPATPIVPTAAAPWPPLVRASVWLHAGAAAGALAWPQAWPWAAAAVVANHALIAGTGLWPRSQALGPNLVRLPAAAAARGEVALTLDDGPDPALTPKVLEILAAHGTVATFFCIAQRALQHPQLVRQILAAGHSVQNHSFRHRHNFSLRGPRGFEAELQAAQQAFFGLTGERPRFFRAPAGLRNPFLQPVLARHGLLLTSWTRRGFDTRERDPQRAQQRLLRDLAGGDIPLLHDGHAATAPSGRPVVLEVLPGLLAALQHAGLRCVTLPQALADGTTADITGGITGRPLSQPA